MAFGVAALRDDRGRNFSGGPEKFIRYGFVMGRWCRARPVALGSDVWGHGGFT